jgi:hypothetical protein
VARHEGVHDELVLIDQPYIRQGLREHHAYEKQAIPRLSLELMNGYGAPAQRRTPS